MKALYLLEQNTNPLPLFNFESIDEDIEGFFKLIFLERWTSKDTMKNLGLSDKEIQELNSDEGVDLMKDYDAYWCDFFTIGIDLDVDTISFFKFKWLLENKFITDENSSIAKRLSYRNYKPQKGDNVNHKRAMISAKNKYATKQVDSSLILKEVIKNG